MDKVLVTLNAADRNGISMFNNQEVLSDSQLHPQREGSNRRVVTLRFSLPPADAEALDTAFHTGNVELTIDGAKSLAA